MSVGSHDILTSAGLYISLLGICNSFTLLLGKKYIYGYNMKQVTLFFTQAKPKK